MEVKYCERVNGNALFSTKTYEKDSVVFTLKGPIVNEPSKYTIEIGENKHIIDNCGVYMNHSFDPTTRICGKLVIAEKDINVGDELNFNYNTTETCMASPFTIEEGYVGGNNSRQQDINCKLAKLRDECIRIKNTCEQYKYCSDYYSDHAVFDMGTLVEYVLALGDKLNNMK